MKAKLILAAVLSTLAAVAVLNVLPAAADPAPTFTAEPLTDRSVFTDAIDMKIKLKTHDGGTTVVHVADPSRTVSVKYTVDPGYQFPWHTHYGPVIVNIISGPPLTFIDSDSCDERTYWPGQAFVDSGHGHVHSAKNNGADPTVFIATFFEAPPKPTPLLIPDPNQARC
jgi:quercetin dioxygenase-like cupin family protein